MSSLRSRAGKYMWDRDRDRSVEFSLVCYTMQEDKAAATAKDCTVKPVKKRVRKTKPVLQPEICGVHKAELQKVLDELQSSVAAYNKRLDIVETAFKAFQLAHVDELYGEGEEDVTEEAPEWD